MRKHLLFIFLLPIILACDYEKSFRPISFYHWKSTFDLSEKENQYLDTLKCEKLYVRLFDVKWVKSEAEAFPFAQLKSTQLGSIKKELVPVVFITNETLQNTKEEEIFELKNHILWKIRQLIRDVPFPKKNIKELQFDCDWSESTQKKYFQLLQYLKENIKADEELKNVQISVTIRLHQIKYQKITGVPPVDKGVLMFYNMSNLDDKSTVNSILDIEAAKKYLENFEKYPLKLDLALPLFSWAVQMRNGKVIKLINQINFNTATAYNELKKEKDNLYIAKESFYMDDSYVYKGDRIRFESVTTTDLENALLEVSKHIKNSDFELIFYHLDNTIIDNYPVQKLKSLSEI